MLFGEWRIVQCWPHIVAIRILLGHRLRLPWATLSAAAGKSGFATCIDYLPKRHSLST